MVDLNRMKLGRNNVIANTKLFVKEIRQEVDEGGIELDEWEEEFVDSVEDYVADGKTLTHSQFNKLREIRDRF